MINWTEILVSDNFYTDPFPHFRIYDVLPESDYEAIRKTYDTCHDLSEFGVTTPHDTQMPDVWQRFSLDNFDNCDIICQELCKYFGHTEIPEWFVSSNALARHEHPEMAPGELIRDWHIDGDCKFFNSIYYIGTESEGHIEIKNSITQSEKSYEFCGNSMLIWPNSTVLNNHYHQFRNSNTGVRRTLYMCWAPKTTEMIESATYCVDADMAQALRRVTDYQGLTP